MACEKCGGTMEQRLTPCPDGRPGCLVAHRGMVCSKCGYWPGGKGRSEGKPPIWTDAECAENDAAQERARKAESRIAAMLQAMGADGPMAGLDPVAAAAVTGAEVKKVKRELFEVQCQANANNQRANRHFEDLQRVTRERDELRATLDPVRDWYDGDGERTDVAAMLRDAIEDLQRDRKDALKLDQVKRERDALLAMTRNLDVHPEGYDGPCECRLCCSYADCEGLDFDRDAK